jgi:hypothetical protein
MLIHTVVGFYFLPFYTTIREKGTPIFKWCLAIRAIMKNLNTFEVDWGKLSQRNAMKRLYTFISKREDNAIEDHFKNNKE